jgi:hypothetical protein
VNDFCQSVTPRRFLFARCADVARASEQLVGRHGGLCSPLMVSALYSYNCSWNQEQLFAKRDKEDVVESDGEGNEDGTSLPSPPHKCCWRGHDLTTAHHLMLRSESAPPTRRHRQFDKH